MTLRHSSVKLTFNSSRHVQIMLGGLVLSIIINTLVLVITALYIPQGGLSIEPLSWSATPLLLILGAIFRLMYWVIRKILKFLATPINIVTLGIASIILNMVILYAFQYVVSMLGLGITVRLGSIEQTFILSIIITLLTLILKKIF